MSAGAGAATALAELRRRPRHLALYSAVAGLLLGPLAVAPVAVPAAALGAAALAGRPAAALLGSAAVLGGAEAARARLESLERSTIPGAWIGSERGVRLLLLEAPRPGGFGARALAALAAGPGSGERVLLTLPPWLGARVPPVGSIVTARGRLRRPSPGDRLARAREARLTMLAVRLGWDGARRGGLSGLVDRVRSRAEAALRSGPPARESALLRGMALGQDEALGAEVRDDFRRAGLSHLVAASGQNVVLLAALAAPLLALAGLGLRMRLGVLLGLIALYVPLAGGGPSIRRAGIMGAAGVVAALAGRPSSRSYALGLAAAGTLALDPRAAADPGWQMSFAAVVGILVAAPRMLDAGLARRVPKALAEALAVTAAATVATAPLIALHFGRVSLVALPANLLAAPAVAPVMWLGLASSAIAQVSPAAARLPAALAGPPLAYIEWVAHVAAGLPDAQVRAGPWTVLGVFAGLAAAGLGGRALARRTRRPRAAAAAVGACLLLVAAGLVARAAGGGGGAPTVPAISFLDVGQGDATLLQDREHAVLVDAGPRDGPILDRLAAAGVRRLDALVITHAQADHEGGAAAVLRRYPVSLLLDGGAGAGGAERGAILGAAADRGVRVVAAAAGQRLVAGRLGLDLLWPREAAAQDAGGDPNDRAVVAAARAGPIRVLLTADAESPVLAPLALGPVGVLKVSHHGSADAGLPDLLARLRPALAVIEVGRHNRYGHPAPGTLAALRAVPRVMRTDLDGTVRVLADGRNGMRVERQGR